MSDSKNTKIDKRMLVNLAKGTTAWATVSFLCGLPALLDTPHPFESFMMVSSFAAIWVPLIIAVCTHSPRNVAQMYIDLFDNALNSITPTSRKNKIKTK